MRAYKLPKLIAAASGLHGAEAQRFSARMEMADIFGSPCITGAGMRRI